MKSKGIIGIGIALVGVGIAIGTVVYKKCTKKEEKEDIKAIEEEEVKEEVVTEKYIYKQ